MDTGATIDSRRERERATHLCLEYDGHGIFEKGNETKPRFAVKLTTGLVFPKPMESQSINTLGLPPGVRRRSSIHARTRVDLSGPRKSGAAGAAYMCFNILKRPGACR